MANTCSTTARRGALDWAPIFEKANTPIFEQLYESVKNVTETRKFPRVQWPLDIPPGFGQGAEGNRRTGDLAGW